MQHATKTSNLYVVGKEHLKILSVPVNVKCFHLAFLCKKLVSAQAFQLIIWDVLLKKAHKRPWSTLNCKLSAWWMQLVWTFGKLHSMGLCDLCRSPCIVRVVQFNTLDMVNPLHVWKGLSLELGLLTGLYDRFFWNEFSVCRRQNKVTELQEIFSPVSMPVWNVPVSDLWVSQTEILFLLHFHLFCIERVWYHATSDFSNCALFYLVIINTSIAAYEVGAVLMAVSHVWLLPMNNVKLCLLCPV
jgi:hypothetical protein